MVRPQKSFQSSHQMIDPWPKDVFANWRASKKRVRTLPLVLGLASSSLSESESDDSLVDLGADFFEGLATFCFPLCQIMFTIYEENQIKQLSY